MVRKIFIIIFLINILICNIYAFDIYFFNVGEGEAIFVETDNRKHILIDSGNLITGYNIIKFFKKNNIEKIDKFIITHPHADHCGGVFMILQEINVYEKYDNGESLNVTECSDLYRWYSEIFRKGRYKILKKGDSFNVDNVTFNILSPDILSKNWNNNSLVIMVKYKNLKILLTADVGKPVLKNLLNSDMDLHADILKIPHHGAEDSFLKDFIKKVMPDYAIISINKNNIRGYPSKKVIDYLKGLNIKLFTTYKDGNIHFKSNGDEISYRKFFD